MSIETAARAWGGTGRRPADRPWAVAALLAVFVLGIAVTIARNPSGATAITAGLGEELLYRRFLQTRLEALIGPWTGVLLASLLFGLMHLPSHGPGPLWSGALQVIAMQGTTGIALGVIWMRWRRLWPCVLAHVLLNGATVILHLLGLLR